MASRKKRSARAIRASIEDFGAEKERRLFFRIYQALTSATPVDTGFARAGWRMSAGSPKYGPPKRPTDRGEAETVAESMSANNDREAASIRESYRVKDGALYVSTAVFYMVFLNRGSSAQAPPAFIERAIAQAIQATRSE